MPDFSKLKYNKVSGNWILRGDLDIVVSGDAASPDNARIEFAKHVLENLEAVTEKSLWYINHFIDSERWPPQQFGVLSLEFGVPPTEPAFGFNVILLNDADAYALWSVSMSESSLTGFSPSGFSVENW